MILFWVCVQKANAGLSLIIPVRLESSQELCNGPPNTNTNLALGIWKLGNFLASHGLAIIIPSFNCSHCNMCESVGFHCNDGNESIGNCLWSDLSLLRLSPYYCSHSKEICKYHQLNQRSSYPWALTSTPTPLLYFAVGGSTLERLPDHPGLALHICRNPFS